MNHWLVELIGKTYAYAKDYDIKYSKEETIDGKLHISNLVVKIGNIPVVRSDKVIINVSEMKDSQMKIIQAIVNKTNLH